MTAHQEAPAGPSGTAPVPPRRPWLSACLSLLGVLSLGYLLGAAVMFFDLPSADFLRKAFLGARAWNERREVLSRRPDGEPAPLAEGGIDKPDKTFDGYTLCMLASLGARSTQASLLDMHGRTVHKWSIPFSRVWDNPPHLRTLNRLGTPIQDRLVCFFGGHLYPNGDLLVVFHGMENTTNGYGLAKLDKDSNVVWKYAANVHHDVDVTEDGTIYAIKQEVVNDLPAARKYTHTPCLTDYLIVLSPEGKELTQPISILEAFQNSAYTLLLSALAKPSDTSVPDILHTNHVRVLRPELASRFPAFKAGQVLISVRQLDTIAVLDTQKRSVVWAVRGPWRAQHDAQFLDNGHLLIFDNVGFLPSSRVLEYDPQTQAFPWSYPDDKGLFHSDERGMCQRLPNGNTLVVNSQGGEIREVSPGKEVVWSRSFSGFINLGRRYGPDQLPFLNGGPRARP
jgi:hypothetical protein